MGSSGTLEVAGAMTELDHFSLDERSLSSFFAHTVHSVDTIQLAASVSSQENYVVKLTIAGLERCTDVFTSRADDEDMGQPMRLCVRCGVLRWLVEAFATDPDESTPLSLFLLHTDSDLEDVDENEGVVVMEIYTGRQFVVRGAIPLESAMADMGSCAMMFPVQGATVTIVTVCMSSKWTPSTESRREIAGSEDTTAA